MNADAIRFRREVYSGRREMTLGELHRQMTGELAAAGIESAALDARWLIAGVLGLERTAVVLEPDRRIDSASVARLRAALQRRLAHAPVSRILGSRAFHGLDLEISDHTLDPRPDTETLVDGLIALVRDGACSGGSSPRIVDVGTGSGAILVALLAALPEATGVAVDIDPQALDIATRNAKRHGVSERATFHRSTWLQGLAGPFDIVVSNPPYIPTADISALDREVRSFDPRLALDGGPDGLGAYRALVPEACAKVAPGGWVAFEIGIGQQRDVSQMINDSLTPRFGRKIVEWSDLTGRTRCVAATVWQL